MTRVYLEQEGNSYIVRCVGHATGSPAMCAAVSCLVSTLAAWVQQAGLEDSAVRLKEADAAVRFRGGEDAQTVFDLMCVGFGCLQATDPTHIRTEIKIF